MSSALVESSKRLGGIYEKILNSDLINKKILTTESIKVFQEYLNEAQPKSQDEFMTRKVIQFLYRKNNNSFSRYLQHAKLVNLILWTDERCIIRHFHLRRVLYIEWDGKSYKCDVHRNMHKAQQKSTNGRVYDSKSYFHSNSEFPQLSQPPTKPKEHKGKSYATILKRPKPEPEPKTETETKSESEPEPEPETETKSEQ